MKSKGLLRAAGIKVSDWLCIPLHPEFHTGDNGIHTLGVETWEEMFYKQYDLLQNLSDQLGYSLVGRAQWEYDCFYWHGKVLTGAKSHWCPEWDDFPIDETCEEFSVCNCFE